jgi:hypothetical protein
MTTRGSVQAKREAADQARRMLAAFSQPDRQYLLTFALELEAEVDELERDRSISKAARRRLQTQWLSRLRSGCRFVA